ncbi:MAG: hypothetical protein JJ992_08960, partial [Planctomycetes bacterium]|nr:hypothetical protein [Planctomycetota bacterium]
MAAVAAAIGEGTSAWGGVGRISGSMTIASIGSTGTGGGLCSASPGATGGWAADSGTAETTGGLSADAGIA